KQECEAVLEDESVLSPPWFARLRDILVVLRDSTMVSWVEQGRSAGDLPEPSAFLLRIMERHHHEEQLVSLLARQDAEAAINVAEQSDNRRLAQLVAECADDFAILQSLIVRSEGATGGSRNAIWPDALAEAALVNSRVAGVLESALLDDGALKTT